MAYTNSPLATVKLLSPNHSGQRTHAIDTITIHCVVGQCTARRIAEIFQPTSKNASSNYGVGKDGDISLIVEEKNRSWCSGGSYSVNGITGSMNDQRAVTIEVASDTEHPFAVTDKAYAALIDLVTDICKRNNIKQLLWKGDKSLVGKVDKQNMTVHKWFANKACPGQYLYDRHPAIAAEVNKRLGAMADVPDEEKPVARPTEIKVGDVVTFTGHYHYASSNNKNAVPCKSGKATVTSLYPKGKHPYHLIRVQGGNSNVYGWVDAADIWELADKVETQKVPYLVKITTDALNIRKGAGTNYAITGCIKDRGVYTIVEVKGDWGKLKSGAGWICLTYTSKI